MERLSAAFLIAAALIPLSRSAFAADESCAPQQLVGTTVRTWPAADADQGAAADEAHFYAVDNSVIAKHDRRTGALVRRWSGENAGLVRHINSCYHESGLLYCANSNYPQTPMGSSIEIFDADTLEPVASHSFGLTEEGSLTWFDRTAEGWIAGFTHYGKPGGLPYKDNRYSNVVAFDAGWRRNGGWLYPAAILDRMAPYGASGGAVGPDGHLYVLGHDLPEMYVLAKPKMGPALVHIATIAIEAEGQAFSWSDDAKERRIFAISRRGEKEVLEIEIPPLAEICQASAIARFSR
ncbi:hypothetical protein [Amphiplicatus metriothermophilus]|uniref:Uncharacterized protein n=1 Tax=Amphiplicatus metriothermophilus TaxID=1519374 RepID=A0A239PIK3_9PROT|nr:hypothetical protein [Amphiplicatus metriothermophilus]MBB5518058.1 hypothetical protein [Amphiplicatus metriothermophilus]SNT67608.1 hypothetical protein SAMN06297382_0098 [Amphiplicatus metriothermophilus]